MLGKIDNSIFLGQSVACTGNALSDTFSGVPPSKLIEMPVAEDMQMGMCIGLSLAGYLPISVYPRMDFLILAMNQLINHLDKFEEMSCGQYKPKVIVRVAVGKTRPLEPGAQHMQDHTGVFKAAVTNIDVVRLDTITSIYPAYKKALKSNKSTILIELCNLYD